MGPLLVLVSPCFGENVVVTCKIGSFLCSLDNLLQKNVIVVFLEIKFQNGAYLKKKKAIIDLLFSFFSHQGKVTKNPSAHISLTYIHVFCSPYKQNTYMYFAHPIDFLPNQFWKKVRIYQVWFLFSVIPCVDSYSCYCGTINK